MVFWTSPRQDVLVTPLYKHNCTKEKLFKQFLFTVVSDGIAVVLQAGSGEC